MGTFDSTSGIERTTARSTDQGDIPPSSQAFRIGQSLLRTA
jgi:hypothetical protein